MADHVDKLINEISDLGEREVESEVEREAKKAARKAVTRPEPTEEIKKKKKCLKEAAASGEISRTLKSIEKLTAKGVESAYAELESLKHIRRQEFLCKLVLDKFSGVLGYLGLVKDADSLKKDLQEDQLLAHDVIRVIEYVEPYVPLIGFLSGSLTVAAHALSKETTQTSE